MKKLLLILSLAACQKTAASRAQSYLGHEFACYSVSANVAYCTAVDSHTLDYHLIVCTTPYPEADAASCTDITPKSCPACQCQAPGPLFQNSVGALTRDTTSTK